jgi:membrane-bound lytic murein transglycosylase B
MQLFYIAFICMFAVVAQVEASAADVQSFINEAVNQHGLDRAKVTEILSKAKHREDILERMNVRAEKKKAWHEYRAIFLTQARIDKGLAYWAQHEAELSKVAKATGVPAETILAILGVETLFGERAGDMLVLDALYTLAFGYPPRAPFFRKELMQFLLLAQEAGFNPLEVKGSYAGAMGASQFISSSYRHYAVDGDGDGRVDLWRSHADIFASVANYFVKNGWQSGAPVAILAKGVDPGRHKKLLLSDKDRPLKEVILPEDKPNHSLASLRKQGIESATKLGAAPDTLAYLMAFEQAKGLEYWLGFHNFYVITRYNRSPLYAMVVYQLSQELLSRRLLAGRSDMPLVEVHASAVAAK